MLSNPGSAPKVSFATRPPDIGAALYPIRVIDTETMLFETDVSKFRGRYATLSHVWSRAGEMNRLQYQKAVTLAQSDPDGTWGGPSKCICPGVVAGRDPIPLLYKDSEHDTTCNIRMAYLSSCPAETRLAVARRITNIPSAHLRKMLGALHATISLGMRYLWADSVCIDSTNMVELAESISCMGDWYRNSPVCLVYLDDETVNSSDFLKRGNKAAKSPRWASRGWTLQEIVMPPHALVFNSSWKLLADTLQEGHKSAVAQMSRIPEAIVCSGRSHNLSAATILQHASTRETTRPEDRAYSLMGLLGVRMSPDYGEGVVSALTRLLETVVNVTGDISVFSWSGIYYGSERPGRSMFPNSFEAYKNAPHGPPIYTSDLVSVTNSGVKSIFQSFMVHVRIEDSNAQIIQIVDSLLENAQHLGISASDSCRLTAKAYYMPVGEHYAPDVREKAVSRSEVCSMEILTTLENVQNYIESFRIYEGWNSVSSVPLEQYFDHLHTHEVPNNLSSLPKERYIWALARFAWSGAPWFLCEVQSRDASHPLKIPKIRRLPAEITAMMSEKEIMKGFQIDGDYGMDVTMEVEEYLIE